MYQTLTNNPVNLFLTRFKKVDEQRSYKKNLFNLQLKETKENKLAEKFPSFSKDVTDGVSKVDVTALGTVDVQQNWILLAVPASQQRVLFDLILRTVKYNYVD